MNDNPHSNYVKGYATGVPTPGDPYSLAGAIERQDEESRNSKARDAATGGGAGLGMVLLFVIALPFMGYYAAFLDTFTTVGFDVDHFARHEMVRNPIEFREVNEIGLLFHSRILDAVVLYSVMFLSFFLLVRKIGYFLLVGLTLIPFLGTNLFGNTPNIASLGLAVPTLLYCSAWLLKFPKFVLPVWMTCAILGVITSVLLALSPNFGWSWESPGTAAFFVVGFLLLSSLTWALAKGASWLWATIT